jgi:hypothetical protein
MKKLKVHYPWQVTARFEKFFIPTLRLEETKREGLSAALHYRIIGKAEFGTVQGKLGVLFTRVR